MVGLWGQHRSLHPASLQSSRNQGLTFCLLYSWWKRMDSCQPQPQILPSMTKVRYGPVVLKRPLPTPIIALNTVIKENADHSESCYPQHCKSTPWPSLPGSPSVMLALVHSHVHIRSISTFFLALSSSCSWQQLQEGHKDDETKPFFCKKMVWQGIKATTCSLGDLDWTLGIPDCDGGTALGQDTTGGRSSSLEDFKTWLDTAMASLTWCWQQPCCKQEVGLRSPEMSQQHPSMHLGCQIFKKQFYSEKKKKAVARRALWDCVAASQR